MYLPLQGGTSFFWSFMFFCLVFVMLLCAYVDLCLVVTCWEGLASWLSFVVYNCEFVTFPLVSWVRCCAWLYRFLIFEPLITFKGFYYKWTWRLSCSCDQEHLNKLVFPILRNLHMKFEFNRPNGFRVEDVWKCWWTDYGVIGILIAHPGALDSHPV